MSQKQNQATTSTETRVTPIAPLDEALERDFDGIQDEALRHLSAQELTRRAIARIEEITGLRSDRNL